MRSGAFFLCGGVALRGLIVGVWNTPQPIRLRATSFLLKRGGLVEKRGDLWEILCGLWVVVGGMCKVVENKKSNRCGLLVGLGGNG